MTTWIIEPRDPLIVRDGRPFGPDPGALARSLTFPFPSTIAGGLRTRAGQYRNKGVFPAGDKTAIAEVRQLGIYGPLLVELDSLGDIADWLLPAPADALLLPDKQEGVVRRRRLVPLSCPPGIRTGLSQELAPVGTPIYDPEKPVAKPPRYWLWNVYKQWLLQWQDDTLSSKDIGHEGPRREERMHVSIEPGMQTAREGFLFLTSGLEFARAEHTRELQELQIVPQRLALAVEADAQMDGGFAPLGGERRLMHWRKSKKVWPVAPTGLVDKIVTAEACRILLLTPAFFARGWQPEWLLQARHGVQPSLIAAAVGRPQVVSGWDFDTRKPKPSRRLAPAGTVYFLKLEGTADDIRNWAEKMWMTCISDDPLQNRLDGFGLAITGAWSGQLEPLEVKDEEARTGKPTVA